MVPPEVRYAKSGDLRIAYQVAGSGPFDLVFVPALSPISSCSGRGRSGRTFSHVSLVFRG
jgi:hypothetical protein